MDDVDSVSYDPPSTPLRSPTRIGELRGVYHAIYILLALSRAFCYAFVRAALPRAIPDEMKTIKYEIFPVSLTSGLLSRYRYLIIRIGTEEGSVFRHVGETR